MKIAILGNMNNNNFAIMRHFRSIGLDAHLLLMKNEKDPKTNHFHPHHDTWDFSKWDKFVHSSSISEDIICAFDFPLSWLLSLRSLIRSFLKKKIKFVRPVSRKAIELELLNFTHIIGSGIIPAVLARTSRNLEIFYPYSMGIEYLEQQKFVSNKNKYFFLSKYIYDNIVNKQLTGIKQANHIIDPDISINHDVYEKYNLQSTKLYVPLLFNEAFEENNVKNDYLKEIINIIKSSDFSILCHSRHIWKKIGSMSDFEWKRVNKNSDWLIKAYSKFVKNKTNFNFKLILFEYGPDYRSTKKLCKKLGINKSVLWVKKIDRKSIMAILRYVDIGVGEFYEIENIMWGGAAVEIMSSGTPLIHGGSYNKNTFKSIYNIPIPPILFANSQKEIYHKLCYLFENEIIKNKIGESTLNWIDNCYGKNAIIKWKKLLKRED